MKKDSRLDIINFINDIILRESEKLKECQRISGMDTPGWGMAMGSIETAREILEYMNELEE